MLVENWAAILATAGGLAVVLAAWHSLFLGGPATPEEGEVLGFGIHEGAYGTQSIVRVREKSSLVQELPAPIGSLDRCHIGSTIRLVKRPHALRVDMRGCAF
jgi:hypothetical protein